MENHLKHNIHLTINNYSDTPITTSQWSLFGQSEPERVAVRFNNKEYVTVLDSPPYFEVWDLDVNGELNQLISTLRIPKPSRPITDIFHILDFPPLK